MNAERLLAHYERIANAPDAIARLRRFILDLAVRGKLVPQDQNDEPAKGFKKPADPVAPFELPDNWKWIEIGNQLDLLNGMAFKPTDWSKEGLRIVRIQNLNNPEAPFNFCDPGMARERSLIDNGSFLISWSGTPGTSFGAFIWDRGTAVLNQHIFRCDFKTKAFVAAFLRLAINGRLDEMIAKAHGGVGLQHITKGKLEALLIPLPPLAEQHRIVAKVDELMRLCDRLEAAREAREATRDRLVAASLARLNAPDPETFQDDVRFALDALPALTTRPDQIKRLRLTILNLAVRGKLVPQDRNDEPASELLKRIAEERAYLVKKKEVRREDTLDLIQPAEMPFDVPASWVWSRIGDAVLFTQYGTSQKSSPSEKGVPVLTMGNIQDGLVVWNNEKRIPETSEELPALYLRKFDLLYNRTNSAELVGKTGIYLGENGARTFASYLIRIRASLISSNPHFLNMAMNTPEFRETQIVPLIKKQTGQANVNGTALKNMLIPVPPLAEQHRIVAKVDELMTLCDRLEASLTATAATRRHLLDALLAEALIPVDVVLASAGDQAAVELTNQVSEKVVFAERSAYILSLAYERHRAARRDRTFGHVKAQKILHLVEAVAGFDLGRAPIRDAAGPNDFKHMLAVERWAREHERFVFETNGAGYVLRQLSDFDKSLMTEHGPDPSARAIATRLIDLFVPMDTRQAEIFATVYSAWNNLLIEGKAPTDTEIVCAARDNWHPDKLKLPARDFFAALAKLRREGIVPKGTGKFVHGPLQTDLFN